MCAVTGNRLQPDRHSTQPQCSMVFDFKWRHVWKQGLGTKKWVSKPFVLAVIFVLVLLLNVTLSPLHRFVYYAIGPEGGVRKLEEYKDCFELVMNHPEVCGSDFGASIPLLIVVTTAVSHFKAREAVRTTWGGNASHEGAKILFLVGLTQEGEVQQLVERESVAYGDMLQANFIDDYRNLTLKTVTMMKWITDRCSKVRAVLKVDDDVMVNPKALLSYVKSTSSFANIFVGYLYTGSTPYRFFTKWQVSRAEYGASVFPPYIAGPAYIFEGASAPFLYQKSLSLSYLFLEDVFMTGVVGESLSFKKVNHPAMRFHHLSLTICNYFHYITSHVHTPEEMQNFWLELKQKDLSCDSSSSTSVHVEIILLAVIVFMQVQMRFQRLFL